jgi:nucleoside-diphosphate-sugar epimerase
MTKKKVFITGATGLLGANCVVEFLNQQFEVVAPVRKKSIFPLKDHPNLSVREGNLSDLEFLRETMQGCHYVVHAAAETQQGLQKLADYWPSNVELTKNLLEIAVETQVLRFLHVSTSNVFGYGSLENLGTETTPICPPFSKSLYVQSKIAAQQTVFSFQDKLNVITVNPTFMLGAYDQKPSSGRIILHGIGKKIIFHPTGGKNFLNASDAAKFIYTLLEHGVNGETYLLSGENLSYRTFFKKLNDSQNQKAWLIPIPQFILILAGLGGTLLNGLGLKNELSLANMRILGVKNYYSNRKVIHTTQLNFQPIEIGIQEALNWFKNTGRLP